MARKSLETVSFARYEIITQAIAMAEAEAAAEAEAVIKAEPEKYLDPVVIPTEEDLKKERLETLPTEGHAVMTHRMMAGWTLLADFGKERSANTPRSFFPSMGRQKSALFEDEIALAKMESMNWRRKRMH